MGDKLKTVKLTIHVRMNPDDKILQDIEVDAYDLGNGVYLHEDYRGFNNGRDKEWSFSHETGWRICSIFGTLTQAKKAGKELTVMDWRGKTYKWFTEKKNYNEVIAFRNLRDEIMEKYETGVG